MKELPLNQKIMVKHNDKWLIAKVEKNKKTRSENWRHKITLDENPKTFLLIEHITDWKYCEK